MPRYSSHPSKDLDAEYPFGESSASSLPISSCCGHDELRLLLSGVEEHVLRSGASGEAECCEAGGDQPEPPQSSPGDVSSSPQQQQQLVAATREVLVKALTDGLSPSNCLSVRGFSTLHRLSRLTESCDAYLHRHLDKMLNMSERELIRLPRVQVNVDVSSSGSSASGSASPRSWSSEEADALERIVASVVRELAEHFVPRQRFYVEEKLVDMRLLPDLSVEMLASSKKLASTEKPVITRKEKIQASRTQEEEGWEVVATHSVLGMGAVSVVRCSGELLVLNVQMVTTSKAGGGNSANLACPISPTTGIPLAVNDAFFSQMHRSRSGFGLVSLSNGLMSVGGFNRDGVLNSVERFDHCTNAWTPTSALPSPRARMAMVQHGGVVYAVGGSNGKYELSSMEVLSNCEDESDWVTSLSRLATPRSDFGAAILDGTLYAVGGTHYSTSLRSVEAFDLSTQQWRPVASMATPRRGVAVVSCNGLIYAIGGQSSNWGCLDSVECYDPLTNKWASVSPLPMPRRNACVVAVEDRIYVIGGYNGSEAISSVVSYSPSADQWREVEGMALRRSSAGAVLCRGGVYVVGGFSGSIFLNSVERYDVETEQWTSYFTSS